MFHWLPAAIESQQHVKVSAACRQNLRGVRELTSYCAVWSLAGAGYGGSSYMDPYGTMRGRNTANMTPEESASLQLLLSYSSSHHASCCSGSGISIKQGDEQCQEVAPLRCPARAGTN